MMVNQASSGVEHEAVATVLIIGASRGIGLETVKAALEAGPGGGVGEHDAAEALAVDGAVRRQRLGPGGGDLGVGGAPRFLDLSLIHI